LRATGAGVHDARMPPAHLPLRMTELLAAALAATLGWVGIGLAVLGPSQAAVSATFEGSGATGATAASLLTTGVPALTLATLLAAGLGVTLVAIGAWLHAVRARGRGRWVIAAGALIAVVATLVGPSGPLVLPGAAMSVMAALIGWSAPRWLRFAR
jgi:hypothetical protein